MLCDAPPSFLAVWATMTAVAVVFTPILSAVAFYMYYVNPTYETWRWKTNPKYPTAQKVRDEIWQMYKSLTSATVFPALSLTLGRQGYHHGYCGINPHYGVGYDVLSFFAILLLTDFYEWFYHQLGHKYATMWGFHRAHHVFFNPSPFSVIADEMVDMSVRALPLLVLPMIAPMNVDLLFFTFSIFFYGYGTYLHLGHEFPWLPANQKYINTSYHHYLHHAISGSSTPYHTGFFFQCWDRMAGTIYRKESFSAASEQQKGRRTRTQFAKVVKPDYSVLLSPQFWFNRGILEFDHTENDVKKAKTGT